MARVLLATVVALLTLAASAQAAPVAPSVSTDPNGDPLLQSWSLAASQPVVWRSCPQGGECVTLQDTGYELRPGPTVAGTRFETTIVWEDGRSETWSSPVWLGPYADVTAPTLTGSPAVGSAVGVQPGTWSGGWEGLTTEHVASCETADGFGCEYLVAGAPLGVEHAGKYLFVTRVHAPQYSLGEYRALPGATRTSGPYGPVSGPALSDPAATGLPVARNGAQTTQPTVTLRTRALRVKGGRMSVGRVTCATSCRVAVKVSGGGKKARTTTFTARGTKALRVPRRRGKLTVTVRVDGRLYANAKVTAR